MPLVEVQHLTKEFRRKRGVLSRTVSVRAVDDVSLAIDEGEMFGMVGESGSGKSTIGRCILRLIEPTSGDVRFRSESITNCTGSRMRELRRHMQMIFQDPFSSLNPRMRIGDIIEEPLIIHAVGARTERRARVEELLQLVGLDAGDAGRYPHQFSGGQRQRIGIARAIALNPAFVVADEPVSALDVSIQSQVIDLLVALKARLNLTFLFIAHDLRLVQEICGRVAVMYRGRIVELGDTTHIFAAPAHPYTRALLSAVPALDPDAPRARLSFDRASFDARASLRQVAPGHWAAV